MITALKNIINDPARIIESTQISDSHLTDGLKHHTGKADVVVLPISTDEVSQIMKYAHQHNIVVTPRGAGTNLAGSTIPATGIVIDLSLMNQFIELDEETFSLTVESGVYLKDVQSYVQARGFYYPPDPGEKDSTIGGNISTNAGGMRAVKYGVTRDYVLALEVVLANGDIIHVGSKNLKDNTGLSLKNLFIGSEGTLGIITRCTLRLLTLPNISETIVIGFESIDKAISSVMTVLKNTTPTALEFVERTAIEWGERYMQRSFPLTKAQAYLIVMYDGVDQAEVDKQRERLLSSLGNVIYHIAQTATESADIWAIRGSLVRAVESVTEQEPIDIVVPINRVADFINYTKVLQQQLGVRMIAFGHAGDGNVHLCILRDDLTDSQWRNQLQQVLDALYLKCIEFKGLPSAEHGIGTAKVRYYQAALPKENRQLMRQIKHAFDPLNILNPTVYQTHLS